jgi:response regulator RpfG family c-di-GMP phosphodiesterase
MTKPTILVIEKNEISKIIKKTLENTYNLLFCVGRKEALELLLSGKEFDLILIENKNGYEIGKTINKASQKPIPLLLMIENNEKINKEKGINFVVDFIKKPIESYFLLHRIKTIFKQQIQKNKAHILQVLYQEEINLSKRMENTLMGLEDYKAKVTKDIENSCVKISNIITDLVKGESTNEDYETASKSVAKILGNSDIYRPVFLENKEMDKYTKDLLR